MHSKDAHGLLRLLLLLLLLLLMLLQILLVGLLARLLLLLRLRLRLRLMAVTARGFVLQHLSCRIVANKVILLGSIYILYIFDIC